MKRITAIALIMGVFVCGGLFAQSNGGSLIDITDQNLNGDELNRLIGRYISNVSNLIPDSTTMQNVWAASPDYSGFWGFGVNGSLTFSDKTQMTKVLDGPPSFGGSNMDLTSFSEALPYLPALAIDMRAGYRGFDIGFTGMYFTPEMLQAISDSILGEGSNFTYGMGGLDLRYTYVPIIAGLIFPNITLQAGYFFTYMDFGFKSGGTEEVEINFRNDTYLVALQISKQLGPDGFSIIPFGGGKMLISKTNAGFSWETNRPVSLKDEIYPDGLGYHSGGMNGEHKMYFQVYGGLGIRFLFVDVTAGVAYNVITEHFGVSASVRARFFGDMKTTLERREAAEEAAQERREAARERAQNAAARQKQERQAATEKKQDEDRQREAERQRNAERQREAERQRTIERQEEEKVQRETERQRTVVKQAEEELEREAAALRDIERLIEEERRQEAEEQAEEASE